MNFASSKQEEYLREHKPDVYTQIAGGVKSQDKTWREKGNLIKIDPKNYVCSDHSFIRTSGIEVICKTCPLGFTISMGMDIKDGHLYLHGEKML